MDSYYSDYEGLALLGGAAFVLIAILIAFIVVVMVACCKMFKKAGKPGWAAIVPIYSYWVLAEIAGLHWWWFLLAISDSIASLAGLEDLSSITSLVSLFASFNIYYNVAKKFNKTGGTAVCAGIFSAIFVLIFGFSKNESYNANIPVSKNGVFGTPEMSNTNASNNVNNVDNTQQNQPIENMGMPIQNQNVPEPVNNTMQNMDDDVIFCSNCGSKSNVNNRFCQNCGKELIK